MIRFFWLLAWLVPGFAADLTGQWAATLKMGGQGYPLHFEFKQTGGAITGAFGFRADFLWPLAETRLEDGKLRFVMRMPSGPEAVFEGTVTGDALSGQLASTAQGPGGALEMTKAGPPSRLPSPLVPHSSSGLSKLSDEFSRPETRREWTTLSQAEDWPGRIERMDIGGASPGRLSIIPRSGAWWAGYHGVYLFKVVRGDFMVTARLQVTGKAGGEPANTWTISGLLVRAPGDLSLAHEQRKENWIYLMTGRGPAQARVVDAKSNRDGSNAWDITPAAAGWYELRIARIGPLFVLLCRPDGEPWKARKLIFRADLPPALQVGLNLTSDFKLSTTMPAAKFNAATFDGAGVDAATLVDWIRFSPLPGRRKALNALAGKPVLDVSDADLLRIAE